MTEGYLLPTAMLISLVVAIFSGYPVAFALAGIGIVFAFIGGLPVVFLGTVVARIFSGILANWLLLAVPLFVFMGVMLDKSAVAKNLLLTLEDLFGRVRGGLAIAVAVLGIVMAASTGIIGASVILLGVLALPTMLGQGYSKVLASGTIAASSTLGILIPPSIMLILMGDILQLSVGDLFAAAMLPGLALGVLYIVYIALVALVRPDWAPLPQRARSNGKSLGLRLVRDLCGPVVLIVTVLGSIITGIATPTEAAAIGAAGAMLLALLTRRLDRRNLVDSIHSTGRTTAMVVFIAIGATCFSAVFKRLGGAMMIEDAVASLALGPWGTLFLIMALVFVMGFFLEWIEISYIVLPLFAPIIVQLDFGLGLAPHETLLWFALLMAVNLQTSFLTPPFGYALFYLRGIAPPELATRDIYLSSIPFVLLQLIGLGVCAAFPALILWLPRLMVG